MSLTLRQWQAGDEEAAVKWSQDRAFCLANEWTLDLPADEVRQWWRKRGQTSPYLRMVVLDDEVVGYAEWQNLQGGVAELGIAIGDSGRWGQGLGARAGQMMLEWAFGPLALQKVWAEVHAPNVRSLNLMRRLGLRKTGLGEWEASYQGISMAMVQFEVTRQEFEAAGHS